MSNLLKILSLMSLTALLFVVVVAGSAQDNDAKAAQPALGDLPANKDAALSDENVDAGIEQEPVPSAAIELPSSSMLPLVPPVSRYEDIWQNSPFELEAAPDVVKTAKESFAKDYSLSGFLKEGEKATVYITNRKTRETHKVTSEGGGEGGFTLKSLLDPSDNVRDAEAMIEKDGEEARITYDKALMIASAGAAMKNHPRSQQNLDNAQNPRQGGANTPQDRSAAAAALAVRARQTEAAAARAGGAGQQGSADRTGSKGANGNSAGNSPAPRAGAAQNSTGRRRIVLPKAPASPTPK